MADADLRRLEREAQADPLAAARLQAERCRLGQHLPPHWPEGLLGVERVVAQHLGPCERWTWQCPACTEVVEWLGAKEPGRHRDDCYMGADCQGCGVYRKPPWHAKAVADAREREAMDARLWQRRPEDDAPDPPDYAAHDLEERW